MAISDFPLKELVPEFDVGSNQYNIKSTAVGVRAGMSIAPMGAQAGITIYNTDDINNYGYIDLLVHSKEPDKLLITGSSVGTGIEPLTLKILLNLNVDVINTVDLTTTTANITGNVIIGGELRGPSTLIIDPAAVGDNTGKVQIKGDLEVLGTTTTISSTSLEIADLMITVAKNATTNAQANGAGLYVAGAAAELKYLSADDSWNLNKKVNITNALSTTGNVTLGDATTDTVTVNGYVGIGVTPSGTYKLEVDGPATCSSLTIGSNTLTYNSEERTLNLSMDGSTGVSQQIGMEQYFPPVHNSTASTITNGTVVGFAGAINESGHYRLTAQPFIANGSIDAEYIMGVATENIIAGNDGFITTFGMVRGVDTTGTPVTETWNVGDVLFAHPTQAGKLTKVKPTAPNVSIPVAAVVRKDAILGEMMVRPTIQQRLNYGSFYSTQQQNAALISTPYAMTFNVTDFASGFSVVSNSRITATNSGLYNFQFSAQIKSNVNSSVNIWIWPRVDGADVPWSASKVTITDKTVDLIASWNFILSLAAGHYFQLMWAVDDASIYLAAPAATAFCPATPSVILTVSQVNL